MTIFPYAWRSDPGSALPRLQEELERVFENPVGFDPGASGRNGFPPVNVFSHDDGVVIRLEVPGVAPGNLGIEARGRTLSISGKREPLEPSHGSGHRRERWTGEFARSLELPADLDPGRAEARCKHGVLTIRVPRREEARPRRIAIETKA